MAGKKTIDVVNSSDAFNLEYMIDKGWITNAAGQLEGAKKIPAQFKHKDGYWVSMRLNNLAIVVNTDKIKPEDEPKSWLDLKNPKYKNKIGFGDPSRSATALIMYYFIYKKFGIEQLEAIMDNGALVMGSLSSVRQALFTGERPVGVTSTYGILAAIKKKNLPLKVIVPTEGMVVLPSPIFIPEGAPNLADAKKFIEFMLSETGQDIVINDVLTYSAIEGLPPPKGMPEISQTNPWIYDWKELYKNKDNFLSQLEPLLLGKKAKKKKK
jgi:iron(III) transport system substrate-binding protein